MRFAEILAMAVQQGGGTAGPTLGPEMVVNGGFDADSDWTGTSWAIAAGVATATTGGVPRSYTNTGGSAADGASTYRCVFTITTIASGSIQVAMGGGLGTARTAPGTYTEDLVSTNSNQPSLRAAAATTASCDNVSVKKLG